MDATEFRRASRAVWEAMAPGWDDRHAYFEQTARPVTERMLERLAPARGHTILELAAGTGIAGFAAAALVGPGGRVIVSDFSEAMVETAERHAAELGLGNVEFRVLDAEQLDLPDEAVDGVLWEFLTGAAGAIAMVLGRLDEDERGRVREQIVERVTSFTNAGGIALPGVSLVASAL
jgi:ubiquinone/menaquinone biosynthesis C-methylase UbiE